MNALKLRHDLKAKGVSLEAVGEKLKVDAPVGTLSEEDRLALKSLKPALLRLLTGPQESAEEVQKSKARWAGPGWIRLFDPVEKTWHEVPSSMCLPGVIAEADARGKRRKGPAA